MYANPTSPRAVAAMRRARKAYYDRQRYLRQRVGRGERRAHKLRGERGLIACVLASAVRDLRYASECECSSIEEITADCWHNYRTAARFLLGRDPEWAEHRDVLCHAVGKDPGRLRRLALEIVERRARHNRKGAA